MIHRVGQKFPGISRCKQVRILIIAPVDLWSAPAGLMTGQRRSLSVQLKLQCRVKLWFW